MPVWLNRPSTAAANLSTVAVPQKNTTIEEVPPPCRHATTKFSTDDSCGGWFDTCVACGEIVAAGMMGHN